MPQLGPEYDLAQRLDRIERAMGTLLQGLGQSFSATQSDGTVGMEILQNQNGNGSTAMVFFQGADTPRDPQTGQHPILLYIGEVIVGGVPSSSAAVFMYPDGVTQSMVVGAGGVGIRDAAGNLVFSTDQAAGAGLAKPYIPMPMPQPAVLSAWASTNSGSWSLLAYSDPIMQHPKVLWTAYLLADAGTTGKARLNINNGAVIGTEHTITSTNTPISELLTLPAGFYGQTWQVAVEAEVVSGTGSVHVQTVNLYGHD